MPEMSNEDISTLQRFRAFGTPDQVQKKIGDLETDVHGQREEIRGLKEKQPKADEVIVKKTDADLLPKYVELGKPDEIKGKLTAGEQAAVDLAVKNNKESAAKFIKAVGLAEDTVETLIALPALQGAVFEVKKGKIKDKAGKEVDGDVGYITLAGEKQKAMSFDEAKEQIVALKGLRSADPNQPAGVPFVKQGSEGAPVGNTLLENALKKNKEEATAGNAIRPATKK